MPSRACRPVSFRFQLGDLILARVSLPMQVCAVRLSDGLTPTADPQPPIERIPDTTSQGYLFRALPVSGELPRVSRRGDYLRYIPLQYPHAYIDLTQSFEDYRRKFSARTRSTLQRKLRRYAEHCGGTIPWKTYREPEEIREFFRHARAVSRRSYQERLLNAGLPSGEDFIRDAEALAAQQRLRAYVLFDGERPVSYLYCPATEGVLDYAYLGYDPDYRRHSVGTVLHRLALEQLFQEGRFRYFDFAEGEGEHKRLFATHQQRCANVYFLRRTPRNWLLIHAHHFMDSFSAWLGATLDRLGLKARIRQLLRGGR